MTSSIRSQSLTFCNTPCNIENFFSNAKICCPIDYSRADFEPLFICTKNNNQKLMQHVIQIIVENWEVIRCCLLESFFINLTLLGIYHFCHNSVNKKKSPFSLSKRTTINHDIRCKKISDYMFQVGKYLLKKLRLFFIKCKCTIFTLL